MSETVILLVDDEKTILDALRRQIAGLFDDRFVCETAQDVEEAREVLAELVDDDGVRVVLVVSDWLMPDVRGDAFLEEVQGRYPGIRRVMLTGQADAAALERVRAEALAHVLMFKPWREDELRAAILGALDG